MFRIVFVCHATWHYPALDKLSRVDSGLTAFARNIGSTRHAAGRIRLAKRPHVVSTLVLVRMHETVLHCTVNAFSTGGFWWRWFGIIIPTFIGVTVGRSISPWSISVLCVKWRRRRQEPSALQHSCLNTCTQNPTQSTRLSKNPKKPFFEKAKLYSVSYVELLYSTCSHARRQHPVAPSLCTTWAPRRPVFYLADLKRPSFDQLVQISFLQPQTKILHRQRPGQPQERRRKSKARSVAREQQVASVSPKRCPGADSRHAFAHQP